MDTNAPTPLTRSNLTRRNRGTTLGTHQGNQLIFISQCGCKELSWSVHTSPLAKGPRPHHLKSQVSRNWSIPRVPLKTYFMHELYAFLHTEEEERALCIGNVGQDMTWSASCVRTELHGTLFRGMKLNTNFCIFKHGTELHLESSLHYIHWFLETGISWTCTLHE